MLYPAAIVAPSDKDRLPTKKGEKMKLSKTMQNIRQKEGKSSISAKRILKLKHSREFNYLVDLNR